MSEHYRGKIQKILSIMIRDEAVVPAFEERVKLYLHHLGELPEDFNVSVQPDADNDVVITWRRGRWFVSAIIALDYVTMVITRGRTIDYVGRESPIEEGAAEMRTQLERVALLPE